MSLVVIDARHSPLSKVNALAKLAATLVLGVALILSIDAVSAGVALALTALMLPFARLPWRQLWPRLWPIVLAAGIAAVGTLLYGRPDGQMHVEWGLLRISDGSIALALAILLRVMAIALPSVVLFATTDPTDLADALAQLARVPARFVLGALAALRLVGLLIGDWRELGDARRARGVADRGRIRRLAGQTFALFVLAIRRGTKLATAMEARGFGASGRRTWARVSRLTAADAVIVAITALIAAAAMATAMWAGTWTWILGL
ncbi:energy-coupling factor transporter transmembrane component T family protein [Microbacterium sp. JZ31]|uniref:energy-coupling factor transporter transmembrane component T family protein n=1 Tax=Microbacterium sp. JZ31 TaxID=1906274 RepID=UPI0019318331|nr:energy-coupling factor transporter transmembrane component T [Microbacterium sp. JZ31]